MGFSIKRKNKINIGDSGALSDLAFLLIIFFIVIAVFNINSGFMLALPQKHSEKLVNIEDIVKVDLTKNNTFLYKGDVKTVEEVEDIIRKKLITHPNMTFYLRIDPETRYQNVVTVVDIIKKLDVENFSFTMIEVTE